MTGGGHIRVGLFAHRLAQPEPTGVGRVTRELLLALCRALDTRTRVVAASTREREPIEWVPEPIETRVPAWPRRIVQLSWCLRAGPQLERSLGHLDVAQLIQPFPPVRSAAPQVAVIHDLFPVECPEWYPGAAGWSLRRSIPLAVRRARRLVVPSRYVASRLEATYGVDASRIEVIPWGISRTFAATCCPERIAAQCARFGVAPGSFVACIGAVTARKNVLTLARAFRRVPSGVSLLLIGPSGPGSEEVDAAIEAADLRGRAIRTGFLSDEQTAALLRGALMLAHPALAEGFGFVPLEAMAAGTPVLAAAAGSLPEVLGSAAELIENPLSESAWAEAIVSLLEVPERRRELVEAGLERAATFRWSRAAEAILDLWREVAAEGTLP